MRRVLVVFGTAREAIRLAPVVTALRDAGCVVGSCVTCRSCQQLDPILDAFDIAPDFELPVICLGASLAASPAAVVARITDAYDRFAPELVLLAGDSAVTAAAGMAAHYRRIPVGHVEAGVRSGEACSSWQEEMNRRMVDAHAAWLFAPDHGARDNLVREGVPAERIVLAGNTAMDALAHVVSRVEEALSLRLKLSLRFPFLDARLRLILVACRRRGSRGEGLRKLCHALRTIAKLRPDVQIVVSAGLEDDARAEACGILGDLPRIHLIDPLDYVAHVYLSLRSHLIVCTSDDLHEEARALGNTILVSGNEANREAERVGGDTDELVVAIDRFLQHTEGPLERTRRTVPAAGESASRRIVQSLLADDEEGGQALSRGVTRTGLAAASSTDCGGRPASGLRDWNAIPPSAGIR